MFLTYANHAIGQCYLLYFPNINTSPGQICNHNHDIKDQSDLALNLALWTRQFEERGTCTTFSAMAPLVHHCQRFYRL